MKDTKNLENKAEKPELETKKNEPPVNIHEEPAKRKGNSQGGGFGG